jgi:hypothetical protein
MCRESSEDCGCKPVLSFSEKTVGRPVTRKVRMHSEGMSGTIFVPLSSTDQEIYT